MFSKAKRIVTILGFDIRIDPSWILIATLIAWSLSRTFFPEMLPGESQETYIAMALIGMLLFFVSLLLHELAHSVMARRYGITIKGITLFLFGGVAELADEPRKPMHEFWIAIMGPLMSLALAGFFLIAALLSASILGPGPVHQILNYLFLVNLVLAIFNMLPAFPLDGGRVLRAWLWHRNGNMLAATESAAGAGVVLAYALIGFGLFALFSGASIGGLWQILIGIFVLNAAKNSVENQRLRTHMFSYRAKDLMSQPAIFTEPQVSLSALVNQVFLEKHINFVPVVEDNTLLGHIDTTVLSKIDRENWANTTVGDVYIALNGAHSIDPNMPAIELFNRIANKGHRKFMVTENKKLIGVITLADLTKQLEILIDLEKQG